LGLVVRVKGWGEAPPERPFDENDFFTITLRAIDESTGEADELIIKRAGPRPVRLGNTLYVQPDTYHGHFMVDLMDAFISRNLLRMGEFEAHTQALLGMFLREGEVAIDIGANIGVHSVGLAEAVGPRGVVLSFEPQDRVYKLLSANLAMNGAFHARAFRLGLGERAEVLAEHKVDYDAFNNVGAFRTQLGSGRPLEEIERLDLGGVPHYAKESIRIEALDHVWATEAPDPNACPSVIKMDIEGMEAQALRGASGLIERCRPVMFVENNCMATSKDIVLTMDAQGYDLYWVIARNFPWNYFNAVGEDVDLVRGSISIDVLALPRSPTKNMAERVQHFRDNENVFTKVLVDQGRYYSHDVSWAWEGDGGARIKELRQIGNLTHCLDLADERVDPVKTVSAGAQA